MHIKLVEIQNYRKLKSCRVEFTDKTTVFVGPNNSGKTSAMNALSSFLVGRNEFTINDFTLSNWIDINEIGEKWIDNEEELDYFISELGHLMPALDVWLHVEEYEIHHVTHLIPSLDWEGGLLGVRLRLEPKSIESLYKSFIEAFKAANKTAQVMNGSRLEILWPRDLRDFLSRELRNHFTVRAYILDPNALVMPENGVAMPQTISNNSEMIEGDPFKKLFLIHRIDAQRGFSDSVSKTHEESEITNGIVGNLSSQLRNYYNKHLNPSNSPDPTDMDALLAIDSAQKVFDVKLHQAFETALTELGTMGYPGFLDPKIKISTKIKPVDGLNHSSAVQFELMEQDSNNLKAPLRLPEQYNGLGYQNLISIIFKMMQFRDNWMRVGKMSKVSPKEDHYVPPLHLVLIEEPEAHLHIQVQQVFIRQAYKVLCHHDNLKNNKNFNTQLIVSTHSGHIAHEMPFSDLRYFRRKPIEKNNELPVSTVVNLSDVFGEAKKTERFVTRYLQLSHCDLLFADAAIIVEGPAERILIPHFIRNHFQELHQKYVTLLEIGGSHAHTLRPLIEALGLTSLIITDLDAKDPKTNKAVPTQRKKGLVSGNETLKRWIPVKTDIDNLLIMSCKEKQCTNDLYSIRVAYQCPIEIMLNNKKVTALPYTFEDALVFENLSFFGALEGIGLVNKFKEAIDKGKTVTALGKQFFEDLRVGKKAEFAIELIYLEDFNSIKVPTYIHEGLTWMESQLNKNHGKPDINVESAVDEMVGAL